MLNRRFQSNRISSNRVVKSVLVAVIVLLASVLWIAFCFIVFVLFAGNATFEVLGPIKFIISIIPLILIWLITAFHLTNARTRHEIDNLSVSVGNLQDAQSSLETRTVRLIESMHLEPEPSGEPVYIQQDTFTEEDPDQQTMVPDKSEEPVDVEARQAVSGNQPEDPYIENYDNRASVVIRALNFANSEDDMAGLAAIEAAMKNPNLSALLENAFQILCELSEIGVITDDLNVDFAEPSYWRKVAPVLTSSNVMTLGGIQTAEHVDRVRELLESGNETINKGETFIITALPVIRVLVSRLNDQQIEQLATTRSIKALLLVRQAMEHV